MHCVFSPKTKTKDVPYPSKKKKKEKRKRRPSQRRGILPALAVAAPLIAKTIRLGGLEGASSFGVGKLLGTGRLVFSKTNYMGKLFFTFVLKKIYEIFFCHLSRLLVSEFGV